MQGERPDACDHDSGGLGAMINPRFTPDIRLGHLVQAVIVVSTVGGGLLAAILIVFGRPYVAWYIRAALAIIAFVYIAGQSAAYLWPNDVDQG